MHRTIFHQDGSEQTVDIHAASRIVAGDENWSFVKPPPRGWEREVPKYKATRDLHPLPKQRSRFEPPYTMISDNSAWQYATRAVAAGDVISSTEWPHPSFRPLNYSAGRILDFFNSRQKSRLPRSPWEANALRLDDGLSGAGPTLEQIGVAPLKRVDLRPS